MCNTVSGLEKLENFTLKKESGKSAPSDRVTNVTWQSADAKHRSWNPQNQNLNRQKAFGAVDMGGGYKRESIKERREHEKLLNGKQAYFLEQESLEFMRMRKRDVPLEISSWRSSVSMSLGWCRHVTERQGEELSRALPVSALGSLGTLALSAVSLLLF